MVGSYSSSGYCKRVNIAGTLVFIPDVRFKSQHVCVCIEWVLSYSCWADASGGNRPELRPLPIYISFLLGPLGLPYQDHKSLFCVLDEETADRAGAVRQHKGDSLDSLGRVGARPASRLGPSSIPPERKKIAFFSTK